MRHGFIKTAAGTPKIQVADCVYNAGEILKLIRQMETEGAKIMAFPELCITGYTCQDLFWQTLLLDSAREQLIWLAKETSQVDALIIVGLPWEYNGKLYNVAAVLNRGTILGLVPKTNLPNYAEYYEARHFTPADQDFHMVKIDGVEVPFGTKLLFSCPQMTGMKVAVEICEDLWVPNPPSVAHALAGANVIINLSAGDEITGKDTYRRELVKGQSARLICGYIYATAGEGESSTDLVFGGHNLICENGSILKEAKRFINQTIYGDLDIRRLVTERRKMTTYPPADTAGYQEIIFTLEKEETRLTRTFPTKTVCTVRKRRKRKTM